MKNAPHLLAFLACVMLILSGIQTRGQSARFSLPEGCTQSDYVPNCIIYKVMSDESATEKLNNTANTSLTLAFSKIQVQQNKRLFPQHQAPLSKINAQGFPLADLSRIYECTYTGDLQIEEAINQLMATGLLEYAQPRYINMPMSYMPNDPFNTNQYQLPIMHMPEAWDIEKGDTNVVIGISDWGVNLIHPDLINNIKYNYEDPIDGIDNDNDGYIDNYYGWDMGCNDNDPTGVISHGTYSTGCASASTDNGTGVSGTGFKCKFIHVKVSDINGFGTRGYESIVYAADHGCKVINCSWGSTFYQGPLGQDIINYATLNRNALVVAAAGNASNDLWYYPASYDYVLSVAGTNSTDAKWSGSSYGYKIDLCAPGQEVWTTGSGGAYDYSSGTSFASPLVAGAAGLLWSHFPAFSALQIAAQLKATCDNIDILPANAPYAGLLGEGRVNMYRALIDTTTPHIEMENIVFEDMDGDHFFEQSDTLSISGDFFNFLAPSSPACVAKIKSVSSYVTVLDSVFNIGTIGTMSSINNAGNPFLIRIASTVPPSQILVLRITITDTASNSIQYVTLTANKDFITMDTNKIAVTLTSNGIIGYNNGNTNQGVGLTFNHGLSLISSAGFIAGLSPTQVSDALPGFTGELDRDFVSLDQIKKISSFPMADYVANGTFSDSIAPGNRMMLRTENTIFGWDEIGKENFIILKYVLFNDSTGPLTDLHAGIFFDWDIDNPMANTAAWDDQRKLSYVFPYGGGIHAGIRLLSPGGFFHYAFDNDGMNGSIKISDGFSGLEKYLTLVSNRSNAGNFVGGNDVSTMLSYGPFQLQPGDSAEIVFAIVVADYLSDLQSASDAAQSSWDALSSIQWSPIDADAGLTVSPNPFDEKFTLNFSLSRNEQVEISLRDQTGRIVFQERNIAVLQGYSQHEIQIKNLQGGLYFLEVKTSEKIFVKKMLNL